MARLLLSRGANARAANKARRPLSPLTTAERDQRISAPMRDCRLRSVHPIPLSPDRLGSRPCIALPRRAAWASRPSSWITAWTRPQSTTCAGPLHPAWRCPPNRRSTADVQLTGAANPGSIARAAIHVSAVCASPCAGAPVPPSSSRRRPSDYSLSFPLGWRLPSPLGRRERSRGDGSPPARPGSGPQCREQGADGRLDGRVTFLHQAAPPPSGFLLSPSSRKRAQRIPFCPGSKPHPALTPAFPHPHILSPAAPPQYGSTPLHYAAQSGLVEIAQILLDSGADPTIEDVVRILPEDLGIFRPGVANLSDGMLSS